MSRNVAPSSGSARPARGVKTGASEPKVSKSALRQLSHARDDRMRAEQARQVARTASSPESAEQLRLFAARLNRAAADIERRVVGAKAGDAGAD